MIPCLAILASLMVADGDVFVSRHADHAAAYHTFRIPAVARTAKGTILAFAEGRASPNDQSGNEIVLRRSADEGGTWGPIAVIASDPPHSLNNPQVVVIHEGRHPVTPDGRVLLMYQSYPASITEANARPGTQGATVRTWLRTSDDDGVSWSLPHDLTPALKSPHADTLASGPGCAIQLNHGAHRGRIIEPFNEKVGNRWQVFAAYSDDLGQTWKRGNPAPRNASGWPNEVQMVELSDGSVMLNCRLQGGSARCRGIALSSDGGESWTTVSDDERLVDPVCMGSIVRVSWPGGPQDHSPFGVLAFSNPASKTTRSNGTLRLSFDEGRTWPWSAPLGASREAEPFAYSALVALPGGKVGCLYETGKEGYVIRFTVVDVSRVTE